MTWTKSGASLPGGGTQQPRPHGQLPQKDEHEDEDENMTLGEQYLVATLRAVGMALTPHTLGDEPGAADGEDATTETIQVLGALYREQQQQPQQGAASRRAVPVQTSLGALAPQQKHGAAAGESRTAVHVPRQAGSADAAATPSGSSQRPARLDVSAATPAQAPPHTAAAGEGGTGGPGTAGAPDKEKDGCPVSLSLPGTYECLRPCMVIPACPCAPRRPCALSLPPAHPCDPRVVIIMCCVVLIAAVPRVW